jgi:hypothetical protein
MTRGSRGTLARGSLKKSEVGREYTQNLLIEVMYLINSL